MITRRELANDESTDLAFLIPPPESSCIIIGGRTCAAEVENLERMVLKLEA